MNIFVNERAVIFFALNGKRQAEVFFLNHVRYMYLFWYLFKLTRFRYFGPCSNLAIRHDLFQVFKNIYVQIQNSTEENLRPCSL